MRDLIPILVPIACGCVLPIMIIWFSIRKQMNDTNKRTQIVLAAIEKNPEMDVEELMKKISHKPKLLKEKLLAKLQWGSLATMLGIAMIGCHFYVSLYNNSTSPCGVIGLVLLPIGIAFLISYFFGKKMLAKEIEAEEQQLTAQAGNK